MRRKAAPLFFCVFFLLFFLPALSLFARYVPTYHLHAGPGMKFKIIGRVKAGEPVQTLKEEAGWVQLKTARGKTGWISRRLYDKGWTRVKGVGGHASVELEFQNIPEECATIMKNELGELKKRLPPVGDPKLELVVSAVPRLRSFHMFLIIDFNPAFYRHAMKRFSLPTTIDLLPYNGCIWALKAYKQAVVRVCRAQAPPCAFTSRFGINLVLRRPGGEEVILETVEDGVYIYFSPYLILERPGHKAVRIKSAEPKKVELLSAFALPYPLEKGDPDTRGAYAVYRFFRDRQ